MSSAATHRTPRSLQTRLLTTVLTLVLVAWGVAAALAWHETDACLTAGHVVLDPAAHRVLAHGQPVELSGREYDLLHALLLNAGRVLSRDQLEQRLYQWGSEINSNAVEVHIYHLRRKLGATLIETVRGVGYCIQREPV